MLWPTGYTVTSVSDEKALTTKVAVSYACEQGSPAASELHLVAKDKQGKRHEPTEENSTSGGGSKVRVITIVSTFSLPQKDIAQLVVQQTKEKETSPSSSLPPEKPADSDLLLAPQLPEEGQADSDLPPSFSGQSRTVEKPYKLSRANPKDEMPAPGQSSDASLNNIQPFDVLQIRVVGTLQDQPIDGFYLVEPEGVVSLGPAYGRVKVEGLTWEQAEGKIVEKLKEVLAKPEVQVSLARRGGETWREAVLPKPPYKIGVFDVLQIRVIGTLLDQPIDGFYLVESTGTVALGPAYGRVSVKGLSLEEAGMAIRKKLQEVLVKREVQVQLARQANQKEQWRELRRPRRRIRSGRAHLLSIKVVGTIVGYPLDGIFSVELTGTVALGPAYGRVEVQGLTMEAAAAAIQKKLQEILTKPEVQVTFGGWINENDPLSMRSSERTEVQNNQVGQKGYSLKEKAPPAANKR